MQASSTIGNCAAAGLFILLGLMELNGRLDALRPLSAWRIMFLIGLMPAALSSGVGSETQRPFAVVITTGLVTAVTVTLFVLPFAYALVVGKPPTTAIESEIEM